MLRFRGIAIWHLINARTVFVLVMNARASVYYTSDIFCIGKHQFDETLKLEGGY